ncbi:glycosyltransferase [Flavobacterium terrigena]|uniref:Glycosyl transferases group 1 n=1 Tax=Flavobacterium terrigena TaxID=402734 RepID=A0A1H6R2C7_9FLAO|nr:glycosyltransferase [Flavobacterium terrigena]SEI48576.1 Glycosyl transferases group 1 [Flavobacterium terrigena]
MEQVKKKILLLSSGDVNGAYEAVYRLAKHFVSDGFQVKMLVKNKTKSDDFIVAYTDVPKPFKRKNILELLLLKIKQKLKKQEPTPKIKFDLNYDFISVDETSVNVSAERIVDLIGFTPDFIYSGMTDNFMNSTDLLNLQKVTKAQVYTITVDMNHFTGGCHFAWDCKGYINGCNTCPAILSEFGKDLAKINFDIKLKNAEAGKFKILAGSGWTLNQAKESKIYKNQDVILNVNSLIDVKLFNNKNRDIAKRIFELEDHKFYILMGCQNAKAKRKGFEYLVESLKILEKNLSADEKNRVEVIIVSRDVSESFDEIPFSKKHIDFIKDYRLLALLYQSVNVFVNSSIEDSGPLMVSEALACGTPVVGFDMGVVNNMVITGFNGYKAMLKDSVDLAKGIQTILELTTEEYKQYSENAVKQVEQFSSMKAVGEILKNEMLN